MVDIVHHSVVGLAGALAAQHMGHTDVAAGFLIGSVIPDSDVVFMALGKSKYLRMHQSVTHSVFTLPFIACLIGVLLGVGLGGDWLLVAIGCLFGSLVHVGLDALNSFGVRALWPLPHRFALDAFFFIDIYAVTFALLAGAALLLEIPAIPVLFGWISAISLYVLGKVAWRRAVVRESAAKTAIPSGVAPLTYFLTRETAGGSLQLGMCRGRKRAITWSEIMPTLDQQTMAILRTGPVFGDLERALKLFRPVSASVDGAKAVVVSRCIAVRNFNNRYGEITSVIVDGKLEDEKAKL